MSKKPPQRKSGYEGKPVPYGIETVLLLRAIHAAYPDCPDRNLDPIITCFLEILERQRDQIMENLSADSDGQLR